MTNWVKCEDELPVNNKQKLLYSEEGFICMGAYFIDYKKWELFDAPQPCMDGIGMPLNSRFIFNRYVNITHWAELPEAPKDE